MGNTKNHLFCQAEISVDPATLQRGDSIGHGWSPSVCRERYQSVFRDARLCWGSCAIALQNKIAIRPRVHQSQGVGRRILRLFAHLDDQGSFGSVFKAMIADSGVVIAVKAAARSECRGLGSQFLQREQA